MKEKRKFKSAFQWTANSNQMGR